MEFKYTLAAGVPCVLVRQPGVGWWNCVDLEHVRMAATTGCGRRSAGILVCGYDYCKVCVGCGSVMQPREPHLLVCLKCGGNKSEPAQGWVVGSFEPAFLQDLYAGFRGRLDELVIFRPSGSVDVR